MSAVLGRSRIMSPKSSAVEVPYTE
jgi:hypothetical protein